MENDVMYLADDEKQLPIKFDPKISSFKTNILESKIDTIGGRYPVFFRNGDVRYQEIGLSGLISYWMTEPDEFIPESELWTNSQNVHRPGTPSINSEPTLSYEYVRSTNLTEENVRAERIFRDRVYAWLTNGRPKLFHSPTEGDFYIRLMNVSLQPNDTVGRMLYSFSATGYECGSLPEGWEDWIE